MRERRRVGALVVGILAAVTLLSSLPDATAATNSKTPTPLQATKSFQFTFVIDVTGTGTGATSSLTLETSGAYKAPSSQDCTADASLGALKISSQMIAIGKKTWIDQGNGFQPAKKSAFDFTSLCPSDPSFWNEFDFNVPSSMVGTPETKSGIETEKLDLTAVLDQLSGLGIFDDDFPADVTFNTLEAWRAEKGGYIAAVNVSLTATTNATCAEALGDAVPVPLTAPCTFDVSYELSNINDKSVTVTAPKVPKKK